MQQKFDEKALAKLKSVMIDPAILRAEQTMGETAHEASESSETGAKRSNTIVPPAQRNEPEQ